MVSLSLFWSRLALTLYLCGGVTALLVALAGRRAPVVAASGRWPRACVRLGLVFHFVSLVESGIAAHHFPVTQYSEAASLLAFLIVGALVLMTPPQAPQALTAAVMPIPFLLLLTAIYGARGASHEGLLPVAPGLRAAWVGVHVSLILLGDAALVIAVGAGILYLIAEHALKSRPPRPMARRLPPLETLDLVAYRSLLFGFPLLTLGLLIGLYGAAAVWGRVGWTDPKIELALLTWGIYLILLLSRWSVGWRGRRAAYFTLLCFAVAVMGWASSTLSNLHRYLAR